MVVRATREGTTPAEDPGVAARTDAEGRFTLDGVTPGSWRVEVEGSGFETLRRVGVAAPSEGLALTVRAMATLEGQVVDAHGEPARGATVTLSGSGVWPPRSFTVFDDGRFRVAELPGGVYELRASRDDDLAEPVAPLLLDPGESREQRMELRPGATLWAWCSTRSRRGPSRARVWW
ncbi:MAG: carboxypeptidase-like regulatory domain-containing protein [Polyangiales bacterium]